MTLLSFPNETAAPAMSNVRLSPSRFLPWRGIPAVSSELAGS